MPTARVLGLDIGGANLKAAHSVGRASSVPFALWRHPEQLTDALRNLAAALPSFDLLAVTMTGELCDCWESNRQGVLAILDSAAALASGREVHVWTQAGRFVSLAAAREDPGSVASANWLALATLASHLVTEGPGLLLDLGSTTADLTPLVDGQPMPLGRTDPDRLASGELVYRGWRRTPLCAVAGPGHAAEFFASMLDACLVLGLIPEDASDCDTADGRPATLPAAHRRLARMLCADLQSSTETQRENLARAVLACLCRDIARRLDTVAERLGRLPSTLVFSGSGEFLLPEVLRVSRLGQGCQQRISLRERLGPELSTAACAHAVAVLAREGDI